MQLSKTTSKMIPVENNSIPAFLYKLWNMVNDKNTNHLIYWDQTGNSFTIQNQAQFWYELLPLYYKHNNMSSFIRQLNMYGFHKILTVENGSMDTEKEVIQFLHPYFKRNEFELLKKIKRKGVNMKTRSNECVARTNDFTEIMKSLRQLRINQSNAVSQLSAMKQENTVLWKEIALLHHKHLKQQEIVKKLIQFLVTVQPTTSTQMSVGVKRLPLILPGNCSKRVKIQHDINNQGNGGAIIHELDDEFDNLSNQLIQSGSTETQNESVNSTYPSANFDSSVDSNEILINPNNKNILLSNIGNMFTLNTDHDMSNIIDCERNNNLNTNQTNNKFVTNKKAKINSELR